ncbi:MAG: tRNA-dihydrouridine synthase family protein, partial [Phycisphaerae bacterium]|nr:tRNA-dihydrouridine synthase family protein [Phycisphaerae bacterium]
MVLAPMAGYTDLAYRLICRRFGAEYCSTEMMLAKLMVQDGKLRRRLVASDKADHPVAAQILGNDPGVMAQAAHVLAPMGFDVVDLNFACPVHKALTRRRGGYLMSQPDRAVEIVRAVTAAADGPVTVKLRQRFSDGETNCDA